MLQRPLKLERETERKRWGFLWSTIIKSEMCIIIIIIHKAFHIHIQKHSFSKIIFPEQRMNELVGGMEVDKNNGDNKLTSTSKSCTNAGTIIVVSLFTRVSVACIFTFMAWR